MVVAALSLPLATLYSALIRKLSCSLWNINCLDISQVTLDVMTSQLWFRCSLWFDKFLGYCVFHHIYGTCPSCSAFFVRCVTSYSTAKRQLLTFRYWPVLAVLNSTIVTLIAVCTNPWLVQFMNLPASLRLRADNKSPWSRCQLRTSGADELHY